MTPLSQPMGCYTRGSFNLNQYSTMTADFQQWIVQSLGRVHLFRPAHHLLTLSPSTLLATTDKLISLENAYRKSFVVGGRGRGGGGGWQCWQYPEVWQLRHVSPREGTLSGEHDLPLIPGIRFAFWVSVWVSQTIKSASPLEFPVTVWAQRPPKAH